MGKAPFESQGSALSFPCECLVFDVLVGSYEMCNLLKGEGSYHYRSSDHRGVLSIGLLPAVICSKISHTKLVFVI